MPFKAQKLKTLNENICKETKGKKRKLDAFLELLRKDDLSFLQSKKAGGSFEENYKALRNELQKFKKNKSSKPSFCLIDDGIKATVSLPLSKSYPRCSTPLFFEDLYHLLLKSILGNFSPFPLCWCKLEQAENISSTLVYVIDGLSVEDILETHNKQAQNNGIFPYIVEILSGNIPFATELSTFHLASGFYTNAKEYYADLFPVRSNEIEKSKKKVNTTVTKLHLLLNPVQLLMNSFPMPQDMGLKQDKDFVFSKDSYSPVTNNSPMFALDCEMCETTSHKNEVTRIGVVNENLETVYHALVKPYDRITNYVTKYSGITKEMLKGVKTTLEDVQLDLKRILPSDAILCGQALHGDLRALKMIHPYVIDTSVIFNQHGTRRIRTSLKNLTKIHLNETIQNHNSGHDPVEDSTATMKLVQLKLANSLQFGDAVLSKHNSEDVSSCFQEVDSTPQFSDHHNVSSCSQKVDTIPCFSDYVKLNNNSEKADEGFFSRMSRFFKDVCLIGSKEVIKDYDIRYNNVTRMIKSDTNSVINATVENSKDFDLIISHFSTGKNSCIIKLNDSIKQTYDNVSNGTLFIVILSGIDEFRGNLKRSLCMVALKNKL